MRDRGYWSSCQNKRRSLLWKQVSTFKRTTSFLLIAAFGLLFGMEVLAKASLFDHCETPQISACDSDKTTLTSSHSEDLDHSQSSHCSDPCHAGQSHFGHNSFFSTLAPLPQVALIIQEHARSSQVMFEGPTLEGLRRPPRLA